MTNVSKFFRVGVVAGAVMLAALLVLGAVALAAEINGTAGDDTLNGTSKQDVIFGHGGNDTIYGKYGEDTLWGGAGSDTVYGQGLNDTLHGEGGNDALNAAGGDDELRGGDGVDTLNAGPGNDSLYDRGGNTAERDTFNCGKGVDTVQADPTDRVFSSCENANPVSEDLLPDLGMAQLADFQIQHLGAEKQLRFSTTIVNIGAGPFEVTGRRPDVNTTNMNTTQRIYDSAGDSRDRETAAEVFYSGDGHEHWHVRDLEEYVLYRLDGSGNVVKPAVVTEGEKIGFCFWDNTKFGSTAPQKYIGCEDGNPAATNVTMGLSRGWGDEYPVGQRGQYLDITSLADGEYRLEVTADWKAQLLESEEANNSTWADLDMNEDTVEVLRYGPSAQPVG
jgi:hypothetical protein